MEPSVTNPPKERGLFPATQWTHIRKAGRGDTAGLIAMDEVCRVYWYPTFATARSKHGMDHHQAEDITQGFWAWLLEHGHVGRAVPERGKFRSFLMTCFDHFVLHEWRKRVARKRGGQSPHISIQSDDWNERFEREMGCSTSPAEHLERVWEDAALEAAFHEVEIEWQRRKRGPLFAALKEHLANGAKHGALREIAEVHELSENNLRQCIFRLRGELKQAAARWLGKATDG